MNSVYNHQKYSCIFLLGLSIVLLSACMKKNKNSNCSTGFCPFTVFEKKNNTHPRSKKHKTPSKGKTGLYGRPSQEPELSLEELQKHLP